MKKKFFLLFILTSALCYAQNSAYLIPRRIYTGDPAVLIMPLPAGSGNTQDIMLTPVSQDFPFHPDIDFHKITLEQSAGGRRLIIEFSAFAPGVLELPLIEIGGLRFSGLTILVNSVLDDSSSKTLSGPASSLAMPGTALMLYGTITCLILIILLTIWFVLKGKVLINNFREKWKHWMLFSSMKKTERRLSKSVSSGENSRLILDKLSEQFRIFLSVLLNENCRTMTAGEFEKLSLHAVMKTIVENHDIPPAFLYEFFRDCDDLRFSGINAAEQDILYLLACLRSFITAAETAEKENSKKEVKAA